MYSSIANVRQALSRTGGRLKIIVGNGWTKVLCVVDELYGRHMRLFTTHSAEKCLYLTELNIIVRHIDNNHNEHQKILQTRFACGLPCRFLALC